MILFGGGAKPSDVNLHLRDVFRILYDRAHKSGSVLSHSVLLSTCSLPGVPAAAGRGNTALRLLFHFSGRPRLDSSSGSLHVREPVKTRSRNRSRKKSTSDSMRQTFSLVKTISGYSMWVLIYAE